MLGVKECWEIDVYYSKLDYSKQISINEIINNTETRIKNPILKNIIFDLGFF